MHIKTVQTEKMNWVNITQVNEDTVKYLRDNHNFHHLDLEDVQDDLQTPKLDTYKNYIFLVLQLPLWDEENDRVISYEINVFVSGKNLITIHKNKSVLVNQFFQRKMKSKRVQKEWMGSSTGYLLYSLLEALFKDIEPMINSIGRHLFHLEEHIFDGEHDQSTVRKLAVERRNILHIRRTIDPQRYLIANLSHIRKPFINEDTSLYFDNVHDYLNKTWAVLQTYKDVIEGLHVTVESLITQRTNKIIGNLTMISVILLPFTLLSSIYGMNIRGLPFAQNPFWVWMMFIGLAVLISLALLIMRRRN